MDRRQRECGKSIPEIGMCKDLEEECVWVYANSSVLLEHTV